MKKMTTMFVFLITLVAALTLWISGASATSGNLGLVDGFCGTGTASCSSCHTNNDGYACDPGSMANCTAKQINFLNEIATGKYCSFCPGNGQCAPVQTGCTSNADCDDSNVCNGAETCDPATGQCQAGTAISCDDGLYCNGIETCSTTAGCQLGTDPCSGQTCDETTDSCGSAGVDESAQLYAAYCADCHGADGSGGMAQEDVRGESGSEIQEAIGEVNEMNSLSSLSFDEIQKIAIFLAGSNNNDGDDDQDDASQDNGDNPQDSDGDGMSDEDEGYGVSGTESMDSNSDGVPDYMDPKTAHFSSDNNSGKMILLTSEGHLVSCSTVNESSVLPVNGKPEGKDFPWGFIDFTVSGVTPSGTVDVTLVMPQDLPAGAQYWKYDGSGYHLAENAVIQGREVKISLADDDGDGIVVDPGAVGVTASVTPSESGSGGGGGGGCSVQPASNVTGGIAPAFILIIMIPFLISLRSIRKKVWDLKAKK